MSQCSLCGTAFDNPMLLRKHTRICLSIPPEPSCLSCPEPRPKQCATAADPPGCPPLELVPNPMHRKILAHQLAMSDLVQRQPQSEVESLSSSVDAEQSTFQDGDESSEELLPVECMSTEVIERELLLCTGRSCALPPSPPEQAFSPPIVELEHEEAVESPMMRRRRTAQLIRADVKLGNRKFSFETNPHVEVRAIIQHLHCFPDVQVSLTSRVICNGRTVKLDQSLSSVMPPHCTHAKLMVMEDTSEQQPTQRFCVKARSLGGFSGCFRVKPGETVRHLRRRVADKARGWTSLDATWALHLPGLPLLHGQHSLADYGAVWHLCSECDRDAGRG
eukprot:TRINITY_DN2853_c0_g1_i1.p1 TRINITY_DN2853_c0_g1~~TRINITY_DN2853_c0_g1_i1.p1  ORF type:complete len:334 (+),score=28.24 TRINITY_DN2853_c0_g1_i1:107-1108(+)